MLGIRRETKKKEKKKTWVQDERNVPCTYHYALTSSMLARR